MVGSGKSVGVAQSAADDNVSSGRCGHTRNRSTAVPLLLKPRTEVNSVRKRAREGGDVFLFRSAAGVATEGDSTGLHLS